MTTHERQERANAADALCSAAFARAAEGREETGVALVAVGGYGRAELAPHSDLDVVLVHGPGARDQDVTAVAETVWYPLWDAGAQIDHSVRALDEVTAAAKQDLRVALGLLDSRHLAGDPSVTLQLRSTVLAHWRRDARDRLPELRELVRTRDRRLGELAHASVPDLKESTGGLRDATVLKALVATWLVDVPHTDLERSRQRLLDVRDVLHQVAGRPSDRVGPDLWPELAAGLGLPDEDAAQRHVREIGRRITHLSRLTWRRVDGVLARPTGAHRRRPDLAPVAPGVAVAAGEVVLDRGADPAHDPLLLLRAAAEAAERDLILAPATASRLARECPALPAPWPAEARSLLARLLAAGPGLLTVWETLDETGGLRTILPEWERVRLLPHASVVHRFTVDRHSVETCIEASRLIRRVARPDLLVLAALLHDIGKGGLIEHSAAGAPVAVEIAERMGFEPDEVAQVSGLVRHHLLLSRVATTRDLEDPATVEHVASQLGDGGMLELLAALTEADARATSPKAWSPWRASLVRELVARVRASRSDGVEEVPDTDEIDLPESVLADPERVHVGVTENGHGGEVTVVATDRLGLLAAVAGVFGLQRVPIRAARAWTQGRLGVSVWQVGQTGLDARVLRQQLEAVLGGRLDPSSRLRRPTSDELEPSVAVRPGASRQATVLEVRVADRPGVVHHVCAALAGIEVSVRSAHVTTLGPQAVDVYYVQEPSAGALGDERAAAAAHAVRAALVEPVTLDA